MEKSKIISPTGHQTLESMDQAVWYNKWLLKQMKPFIKGDILEIGSGIGNFSKLLVAYGKLTATDIDKEYLKIIKKKLPQIEVGFGDIEHNNFFFKNRRFDTIICINVLEHINNDKQAIFNLTKLLKKRGNLILIIPAHGFLFGEIDRSIDHYRRYQKSDVEEELKKLGLKIRLHKRLNFIGAIGWFFAGKITKDPVVKKRNIKIFNIIAPILLQLEKLIEPPVGISILSVAQR